MKRLAIAVVLALAVFGGGTAWAAKVFSPYTAPGIWFSPGQGYGSSYDGPCGFWVNNTFSKGQSSWGLITFINTGGGWAQSMQGAGVLSKDLALLDSRRWVKKLHCKNNKEIVYQGGCYGLKDTVPCA